MEREPSLAKLVYEYRQKEINSTRRKALMEEHGQKATIAGAVLIGATMVSPVAGVFILPEVFRQVYLMENYA